MWIAAQEQLEQLTGARLRIVTDSRLETFTGVAGRVMAGVVTKYPLSNDKYEMRARFECRARDCKALEEQALDLFNSTLNLPRRN